jgi:hypothetical protein
MTSIFFKPKPILVRARLLKEDFAIFHKGFHHNKPKEDPFYKKLSKMVAEGLILSKVELEQFKPSFSIDGFSFKSTNTKFYNMDKKICMPDDCIDRDVIIKLLVTPYDFVVDNKQHYMINHVSNKQGKQRLVGISIKALTITAVPDKE